MSSNWSDKGVSREVMMRTPSRGDSKCKGPDTRVWPTCWRSGWEASVMEQVGDGGGGGSEGRKSQRKGGWEVVEILWATPKALRASGRF